MDAVRHFAVADVLGRKRSRPRIKAGRRVADKPVAATRDRANITAAVAVLAERAAHRIDLHLQVILFDGDAGPDLCHQLGLRHQRAIGGDERAEHVQRALTHHNGGSFFEQAPVAQVQLERTEGDLAKGLAVHDAFQNFSDRPTTLNPIAR